MQFNVQACLPFMGKTEDCVPTKLYLKYKKEMKHWIASRKHAGVDVPFMDFSTWLKGRTDASRT